MNILGGVKSMIQKLTTGAADAAAALTPETAPVDKILAQGEPAYNVQTSPEAMAQATRPDQIIDEGMDTTI